MSRRKKVKEVDGLHLSYFVPVKIERSSLILKISSGLPRLKGTNPPDFTNLCHTNTDIPNEKKDRPADRRLFWRGRNFL